MPALLGIASAQSYQPSVSDESAPRGVTDDYSRGRRGAVRLAQASETPEPQGSDDQSRGAGQKGSRLEDKVRRAGELVRDGELTRARDLVSGAIRGCDAPDADVQECSRWSKCLDGLKGVLDKPGQRVTTTNSLGMKLVRVPAGDYMMGSLKQEMDWLRLTFKKTWRDGHKQWFEDELPLHPVRITKPMYMSATEVTVGQFRQFVKETNYKTDAEKGEGGMIWSTTDFRWSPRKEMKWDAVPWKIADDQPVVFVSWNDTQAFCRWLSRKEKQTYRLPTEAEWEMACRGGRTWARYPWGNRLPGDRDTNFGDGNAKLPESLTTVNDGFRYVSPAGSYPPNGFGLYDMSGNVMEWVQDRYGRNYYENSPVEDPQGPTVGQSRVNKGGNWYSSPADDRCAFRGFSGVEMSFWNLGFRVVMETTDDDPTQLASRTGQSSGTSSKAGDGDAAFPPSNADGMTLFRQAMFAAQQQQWDEAIQNLEDALKVYEQRQDYLWTARVRATLAGIYAERNRPTKSKELYSQALAEFRKVGDTSSAKVLLARLQDLETSPGIRVAEVRKGSAAEKAGIVKGDTIIEYAGETGFRVSGFKKIVEDFSRESKVTVSVMNNNEITTTVVPGGQLGIAVEDMKRPPRPRPTPAQLRAQGQGDRNRPRRDAPAASRQRRDRR